jgi:hypothetical protein
VLALSVAFVGTLAAAPQGEKGKAKAKSEPQKSEKTEKAAPKGTLMAADLPKAVTDAVMSAHPGSTITSATKSGMGAETVYTVHVKAMDGGKSSNVTMRLKDDGTMATPSKGATKMSGKKKDK